GETPLHWAAVQGFVEIVEVLLSSGAHGEMVNWAGQTALLVAAEAGHGDVVRLFLENGVNVDGAAGDTALVVAARQGHQDIVRMLLEEG
ncbi:ankyrin, partial [Tuber magnatum]